MYKKLISNKIFWLFVLTHILLFNINYAEWGDSYRILRAEEFIRHFDYPRDEKRQPLYSAVLALRPENISPIFWGRTFMFFVSMGTFALFFAYLEQYNLSTEAKNTALMLFAFNPVFLYWSLRIYADVFFALLVLLNFYLYGRWHSRFKLQQIVILGLITGLAILTRFEGFILAISLGLGFLLRQENTLEKLKKAIIYAISAGIIFLPWFIYRNPFASKYLSEPQNRAYDLQTILIYLASLLFLFGFTSAFYFVIREKQTVKDYFRRNKALAIYLILELILVLFWPAAVPRLFVPAIPFLVIILAELSDSYFDRGLKNKFADIMLLSLFLGLYIVAQYFLKLQFLILIKSFFIAALLIQLINIFSIFFKKRKLFQITLLSSLIVWSLASIWLHKDIYKAIVKANLYVDKNLEGRVAYNDVSSVSDWYLNQSQQGKNVSGIYLNMDSKEGRSQEKLQENKIDYVMITNEHNPTLEFNASETDYLEEIKEFRYTIRGTEFFTKIMKVRKQ
jgi:hypothetical protein